MLKTYFSGAIASLACLLFLVATGAAVTVNVTPLQINPGDTITVNVTGLEDGVNLTLAVQSLFDVQSGAPFTFELDNVTLPVCLNNGNVTVSMQNTVNNTISVKKGDSEVILSGTSVNGLFTKTIPFSGCLNGTFDFIRVNGTALSSRDNIVATTSINGTKTGLNDFVIPFTINGVEAGRIRITAQVNESLVFDGTVTVDNPSLRTGSIFVTSLPAGADVYIDGLFYGTSPKLVTGLPVGTRNVVLVMQGFRTFTGTAEVSAGFTRSVFAALRSNTGSPFVTLPIGGAFGEPIVAFTPPDDWEIPGFTNGFFNFPGFITV